MGADQIVGLVLLAVFGAATLYLVSVMFPQDMDLGWTATRPCERCAGGGIARHDMFPPNYCQTCSLCGGTGLRDKNIPVDSQEPA